MKAAGNAALFVGSNTAGAGVIAGIVAALLALLFGRDLESRSNIVGLTYWILAVIIPAALVLGFAIALDMPDKVAFRNLQGAWLVAVGGLIGAAIGSGPGFMVTGVNVPVILGGMDATAFSEAVRGRIFWVPFLIVLGVTLLAAIPATIWAQRRAIAS